MAVDPSLITLTIDVGTAVVSIVGAWGSAIWMLRGVVDRVDHTEKLSGETAGKVDNLTIMNGDSLHAIREKITQTELWNRDNFVRRSDFDAMRVEMRTDMAEIKMLLRAVSSPPKRGT